MQNNKKQFVTKGQYEPEQILIRRRLSLEVAAWVRNQLAGGAGNYFSEVRAQEMGCLLSDLQSYARPV